MKLIQMTIVLTCLLSFAGHAAKPSPESVRELLVKTGSGELGVQVMRQMIPAMKTMIPDAPDQFWEDFMASANPDELIKLTIPVYQKHLSQSEIDAIIAFYDTPAGKKLITVQPAIVQETMALGQSWGQQLGMRVLQKYQAQKQ